jgi:hypothetical protein
MTGTLTASRPTDTEPGRHDRSVPLLIGAGMLVILVVGAVLLFAVDRPPALRSLAEEPDPAPTSSIAYITDQVDGTCVRLARSDATTVGPWCDRMGGELVGWDEEGLLLRRWDSVETVHVLDPATGEIVGRTRDRAWREPDAIPVVWSEHRDGELIVRLDEDDTELWRVESGDRYEIRASARSADEAWVAMVDSADRLLVVAADGSAAPRVWTTDVASWQWPVWEGTTWTR